ncbi:FdtA/QdtA family cupin domain-containing protein [Pseudomonas sp. SWRI102]|uniref:FdtA/QdtA family cupin domain-containing protein n=1 Tax=Pseudomonas marvdashtae TaxID=2745500 RepID=A0A923JPB4_9PSED|nr:FdtA/QdtA family cupin domain-containing protein [Pseudomonas marvdashtae]MBV4553018.1 FdtA/QdtA family cupin domain-containing protein [Pseudomonas marvdashtae]
MSLVKFIQFPVLGDERGQLYVMEGRRNIPFDVKRAYYLVGTLEGVSRGFHAHKELQQIAVCVSGKCKMLLDDGVQRSQVLLDEPNKAICIDKMVWHEMHDFTHDCVMLVLASDYYDESDYIRNYDDFLKRVKHE